MSKRIKTIGTTQEWGTDELRILTVRNGIPTHVIISKCELQEELNLVESYPPSQYS